MIFSSDDNMEADFEEEFFTGKRRLRGKKVDYKNSFKDEDDESDVSEGQQHDSDNDPDFRYDYDETGSESEDERKNRKDQLVDSDDGFSVMSNMTDFQVTLDMLNSSVGDTLTFKKSDILEILDQPSSKTISQRKMSEECKGIYGKAKQYLWEKNYEGATELCAKIIKEYPTFGGSYNILGQIYEEKGDLKKANELYYTSVLCDPKDINKWMTCIENTKNLDGIEKAIEAAKMAVSRTQNLSLRKVLIDLLIDGGYEKEAFKKKLVLLENSVYNEDEAEEIAHELVYMSEKFESWKDEAKSAECLEILNRKYPQSLTNDGLINLVKVLTKLKRYNKVLNVSKNIEGITINLAEFTESSNIILFNDELIDKQHKHDLMYGILMSILHLKMPAVVLHRSFSENLNQLTTNVVYYMNILLKLFDFGFYNLVIVNVKLILDSCDQKLALLKLLGQSQEKLDLTDDALLTYDIIINEVNGKESSVWELKANLLYKLKREQDAINVLAESQKFVSDYSEEVIHGMFISRTKPTKESAQLLYKLCLLLQKEGRTEEYIKVAWKYIFIDSYQYFKLGKVKLFCEDMSFVKNNFIDVTNSLWACISSVNTENSAEKSLQFKSSHAKTPYENEAWQTLETLLNLLLSFNNDHLDYIEVLAFWGLVLHKFLNWNAARKSQLSAIYISTALINRINNVELRPHDSGLMISSELKHWKDKFSNTAQYWNMMHLYCRLSHRDNNRVFFRALTKDPDNYFLKIINSGYLVSHNVQLSITVNSKLHYEYPKNPQFCLHLAITYLNNAVSRIQNDNIKPMELATFFLHQYRTLRGDCQETWYNMGRFYHRISFYQYAMPCYEKCLEMPPVGNSERERMITNCTKQAAFNLVLIYKERKNTPMIAYITQKYLVI